jgi:hypothetical protein
LKNPDLLLIEVEHLAAMYQIIAGLNSQPDLVEFFDSPGGRYILLLGSEQQLGDIKKNLAASQTLLIREVSDAVLSALTNKLSSPLSEYFLVIEFEKLSQALKVIQSASEDGLGIADFKVYRALENRSSAVLVGQQEMLRKFKNKLETSIKGLTVDLIFDQNGIAKTLF